METIAENFTVEEISNRLVKGDATFIAKTTGYERDTVERVLSGKRKNSKIIKAARMLLASRQSLEAQIAIMIED